MNLKSSQIISCFSLTLALTPEENRVTDFSSRASVPQSSVPSPKAARRKRRVCVPATWSSKSTIPTWRILLTTKSLPSSDPASILSDSQYPIRIKILDKTRGIGKSDIEDRCRRDNVAASRVYLPVARNGRASVGGRLRLKITRSTAFCLHHPTTTITITTTARKVSYRLIAIKSGRIKVFEEENLKKNSLVTKANDNLTLAITICLLSISSQSQKSKVEVLLPAAPSITCTAPSVDNQIA